MTMQTRTIAMTVRSVSLTKRGVVTIASANG